MVLKTPPRTVRAETVSLKWDRGAKKYSLLHQRSGTKWSMESTYWLLPRHSRGWGETDVQRPTTTVRTNLKSWWTNPNIKFQRTWRGQGKQYFVQRTSSPFRRRLLMLVHLPRQEKVHGRDKTQSKTTVWGFRNQKGVTLSVLHTRKQHTRVLRNPKFIGFYCG